MQINTKPQRNKTNWLRLTALAGLSALAIFAFYQDAQAGPVTGGPGNTPYVKLGVYQGVLSIVPGGASDSVMEIGNAGRDIGSTGAINIHPDAATVTIASNFARFSDTGGGQTGLALTGSLCLEGSCLDVWADICTRVPTACSAGLSGTTNYLAKFTSATAIGNSGVSESGGYLQIGTGGTPTRLPTGTANVSQADTSSVLFSTSYNNPGIRVGNAGYVTMFGLQNPVPPGDPNGTTGADNYGAVFGLNSFYDGTSWYTKNPYIDPVSISIRARNIIFSSDDLNQAPTPGNYTPTERVRITGAGNVGIGQTVPGAKLAVNNPPAQPGKGGAATDTIYGFSSNGATISAEQSGTLATDWAGYFAGRLYARSSGTNSRTIVTEDSGQTKQTFLVNDLGGGGYSGSSVAGDSGLFFPLSNAFVIAPWSAATKGLRMDGDGSVAIGYSYSNARLTVNALNTGNAGSANDTIASYNNSVGNAIYGNQTNISGWAGYFEGGVNVNGRLCLGGACITQWSDVGGGGVGPGTTNQLAKFTGANTIGDSAIYENGGNVGIGNSAPAAKVVINDGVADNGNVNDTFGIYSNKSSSALYVKNATGWAGFFSGAVNIDAGTLNRDALTVYQNTPGNNDNTIYAQNASLSGFAGYFQGRVTIAGNLYLGGRLKPVTLNVCQVGTDNCLGEYLWTLSPSTTSAQYCYYTSPSASVPAACVNIFSSAPSNYCIAPDILINRTVAGRSLWSLSGCTGQEYQYPGYGAYGSGQACLDVDGPSGVSMTNYTSSSGCTAGGLVSSGFKVAGVLTQNIFSQAYELR